nr:conotoxin precursor O1 [Conus ebraeus]
MKLTCMMIVAALFLTAWTFVTADDSINGPDNRGIWGKPSAKARDEMKNPKDSEWKWCHPRGEICFFKQYIPCCSGKCEVVCL